MFDYNFFQDVRKKKFHSFGNKLMYDILPESARNFNWDEYIKLLDSHPTDKLSINKEKMRYNLLALERRGSQPEVSSFIVKQLKDTFKKNRITSQIFSGIGQHRSFLIHRDVMDVLYFQALGEVELSLWEPKNEHHAKLFNLTKEQANLVYTHKYKPGSMMWVPRGTYHLIEPYSSRVAFSFGVEGDIDPSTYI